MPKSKIIIADDHTVVRVGLKELINKNSDLTVVAEAKNGRELIDILINIKCDLVVMDISMPEMDGVTALKEIHQDYPTLKVLILSMLKDYPDVHEVMAHGAGGYLVKGDAPEGLVSAMETILKGKIYENEIIHIHLHPCSHFSISFCGRNGYRSRTCE